MEVVVMKSQLIKVAASSALMLASALFTFADRIEIQPAPSFLRFYEILTASS
jgi:hypothetical protein